MDKSVKNAPKRCRKLFFLLITILRTFWAERMFILVISIFYICGIPDSQISRFKAVSWHVSWPTGLRNRLDQKMVTFYNSKY